MIIPKEKAKYKRPKKGDKIYVGSSYYIDHGEDDFDGGICTIERVISPGFTGKKDTYNVVVKEKPDSEIDYEYLMEHQAEWKRTYGRRKGKMNPDLG